MPMNTMETQKLKAQRLRDLHTGPKVFLMPNAWDGGSARMLASHGFPAIASTSAGIAYSLGVPDYVGAVTQAEMLSAIQQIARSVEVPVSADLEAGYGVEPEQVAKTIELAIAAGAVGGNIEDFTGDGAAPLFNAALAAQRIPCRPRRG
jgi:2-methylisocitrate lyase-like PEP mutase family enzyme